ncbi:MAG: cytochrome c [Rhodocyclaceae bacterium]|nr:cytochrome c [Rhodocyclaceae bacterium]
MKSSPLVIHIAVLLSLVALASSPAFAREPAEPRRSEIVRMVRQDCGSCHGLTLQGGLGPALTPAALAQRPLESLVWTVLQGRPGTAMPGWSRFLDEAEARWVIARLAEGFPQEYAQGEKR